MKNVNLEKSFRRYISEAEDKESMGNALNFQINRYFFRNDLKQ